MIFFKPAAFHVTLQ